MHFSEAIKKAFDQIAVTPCVTAATTAALSQASGALLASKAGFSEVKLTLF
jgi:hypothetical protein